MEVKQQDEKTYDRAVVIGSGIAGLTAARVLRGYFRHVTIVERDQMPAEPRFRVCIPQAYHAHTLLPLGQLLLEQQFPHLMEELFEKGAILINDENEIASFEDGVWRKPQAQTSRPGIACSRPLLETSLYQRVTAYPEIKVLEGYEVSQLLTDPAQSSVRGVQLRERNNPTAEPLFLAADLVIDASGRGSKAPEWLKSLGFPQPEEWRINAFAGYASRLYQQPEGDQHDWKKLYINPSPPYSTRGGVITPLEGGRWHVTLIGVSNDFPPTDEEGFLAFARSLPSPALYEAIRAAKPIGKIYGYRKNENRVRRYECLPRYLEGFLVLGDAVFTMNPVYALGMTSAALGSKVLGDCLKAVRSGTLDLTGLAGRFQQELARSTARLWQHAIQNEWRWPTTDITDNTEEIYTEQGTFIG